VTELADQGKMDDSCENSTVPKIVIDQTPCSSAHSDDSGLGGESNATLDGKFYPFIITKIKTDENGFNNCSKDIRKRSEIQLID